MRNDNRHDNRRGPSPARCLLGLLLLASAGAGPASAHQIGVFFDPQGQSCVGEIRPFGQVDVYVLAILDQESDFSGAVLSLRLAGGLAIVNGTDGIIWPRSTIQTGNLLTDIGIDLRFQRCPRVSGAVELFRMTLEDLSFGQEPRPDLLIEIGGGMSPIDSTLLNQPHLKICDSEDPSATGQLVRSTPLRATLNCTSDCPCTVTVAPTTWSAVKRRFRED